MCVSLRGPHIFVAGSRSDCRPRINRSPPLKQSPATGPDRVPAIRIQEGASHRLDDIYRYTRDRWGEDQAKTYIPGLFEAFDQIAAHGVASRPIPADFGVDGFFFRYERPYLYWRYLSNGDIAIVTILHHRMHQIDRFRHDFGFDQSDGLRVNRLTRGGFKHD